MARSATDDEYWIVGANPTYKEGTYTILRQHLSKQNLVSNIAIFDVPTHFKFGSFDFLIELTDNLIRLDKTYESLAYFLEAEILQLNPRAHFQFTVQNVSYLFEKVLFEFSWNDAKFPIRQQLKDIVRSLDNAKTRAEEQTRVEINQLSSLNHQMQPYEESLPYQSRDLTTVISARIYSSVIMTRLLTTVFAVIPPNKLNKWMDNYELYSDYVVPQSSKMVEIPADSQGNCIYTALVLKSKVQEFINGAKNDGFTVRYFDYDVKSLVEFNQKVADLKDKRDLQFNRNLKSFKAIHSEVVLNWLHIKALRIYVEAVLRYGVPPSFQAYVIKPNLKKTSKLMKELQSIFDEEHSGKSNKPKEVFENDDSKLGIDLNDLDYPFILLKIKPFNKYNPV